mgnify:CR=1 FL=1
MAEVVKVKERKSIVKIDEDKHEEEVIQKRRQNAQKKSNKEEKNSLWVKFRIFCHGVKTEFTKVHWTSKSDMVKYSIATIIFIIFCSLFFYGIDALFAFFQALFK